MIPIIRALENVPLTRRTAIAWFREQRNTMKVVIFSIIPSLPGSEWMGMEVDGMQWFPHWSTLMWYMKHILEFVCYYKIRWYVHTLGMIRYTVDHQYTHFYANIHMYNKVIKILSFQWRPFWKFKMAVTAPARSRVFISYMILIITNYQYTKFHVNIHMHNKVIEILSFQGRPFWKFKMAVTTAARSCVFISYMILILKNY